MQRSASAQDDWLETSRFKKKIENNVSFMDDGPLDIVSQASEEQEQEEIDDYSSVSITSHSGFSNIVSSTQTKSREREHFVQEIETTIKKSNEAFETMKDISENQRLNLSDLGDEKEEIFVPPDIDPLQIKRDTGQISKVK